MKKTLTAIIAFCGIAAALTSCGDKPGGIVGIASVVTLMKNRFVRLQT